MLMKTYILYFTTCFHGFGILRHVDPFVRMLHIYIVTTVEQYPKKFNAMYCIVLYCIMRPYTDGPIGPLSYRHSSGVVRNPHSALAE